jgi:predicted molibdopterin-dependent oxidoreductase YjgC
MSESIQLSIDGRQYETTEGKTVLEIAREHGIDIPTLCYHPALKPSGSCRLCVVEVIGRVSGKPRAMLSCVLKAQDGMVVRTDGEIVMNARRRAFRALLKMAPQSPRIVEMAKRYIVDPGPSPDGCIRCRLCIRICEDIVGPGALKMENRDGRNYVVPIEGRCIGCGTCANICPTQVIQVRDLDNVRIISIRDEVIGKHPLERCEGCGRLFATPKFLDHIRHRTTEHTAVKTRHRYCPSCAKLFSDRVQSMRDRSRK